MKRCSRSNWIGRVLAMKADEFRALAQRMPNAVEGSHMGTPDFRVGGRIFATLHRQENGMAMIKLTPVQQAELIEIDPDAFAPIPGGWGLKGATQVRLAAASRPMVLHAMRIAWRNVAPARLLDAMILAPVEPAKRKSPAKRSPARKSPSKPRR